ncbi:hypothetical protein TSOC_015196, partial [Tetrabaena socialis]
TSSCTCLAATAAALTRALSLAIHADRGGPDGAGEEAVAHISGLLQRHPGRVRGVRHPAVWVRQGAAHEHGRGGRGDGGQAGQVRACGALAAARSAEWGGLGRGRSAGGA